MASLLIAAGPQQLQNAEIAKSLCHGHDVALLLEGDTALALKLKADGVHLPADASAYAAARAGLAEDQIIGVDCGTSRHLAMSLGELGADYIGFSGLERGGQSIIAWWSEIFVPPCVLLDPCPEADVARFAAEGVDFIRPPDAMWQSDEAAALCVENYNKILGN